MDDCTSWACDYLESSFRILAPGLGEQLGSTQLSLLTEGFQNDLTVGLGSFQMGTVFQKGA